MNRSQLDLFAPDSSSAERQSGPAPFVPPPEFIERTRAELTATLAMVSNADSLPWPDLTKMTLAEIRFRSMSTYLPQPEAEELRAAFDVAMTRIYEIEDARMDAEAGVN